MQPVFGHQRFSSQSQPSLTSGRPSVLVVEDDPGLRVDLVDYLDLQGWSAIGAGSAADMWTALQQRSFDLLVLDLGLPDASGMVEMPKLRLAFEKLPILVLSAFSDTNTRVRCLQAGADVYLVKDASLELIHASCSALMRRLAPEPGATLPAEPPPTEHGLSEPNSAGAIDPRPTWHLHLARCALVTPSGAAVELSLSELQLLQALMGTPGIPFARDTLLRILSKAPTLNNLRNLDGSVARLRRKVDQVAADSLPIRSFYGRGYAFMGHVTVEGVALTVHPRAV